MFNKVYTVICSVTMIVFMTDHLFASNDKYETLRNEVIDSLLIEDSDIRTAVLETIKRNYNISDDDYSSLLVEIAESPNMSNSITASDSGMLHMFSVAALADFGTTNSLSFLEKEVLCGSENVHALFSVAMITGFDDRLVKLADTVFSQNFGTNSSRRLCVYNIFDYGLNHLKTNIPDICRVKMSKFIYDALPLETAYLQYAKKIIEMYETNSPEPLFSKSNTTRQEFENRLETENSIICDAFVLDQKKLKSSDNAGQAATAFSENAECSGKHSVALLVSVLIFSCILVVSAIGWILRKK